MHYAIVENHIVTNVIWLYPNTDFPNAVPCGDVPVQIGDTYLYGKFYRGDKQVLTPMEEAEERHIDEVSELIELLFESDLEYIFGGDDE